jgi:hypothetical protein
MQDERNLNSSLSFCQSFLVLFDLLCLFDSAKGRSWHWLFMAVLYGSFRAKKARVLFAGVCLYLCFVVEVAVVVAVVAVFFY